MAIVWADVVAIAPELSATPGGGQTAILASVALQVNATAWGDLAPVGAAYLAAHLATLARLRGSGAVTSESVGALSRAYLAPRAYSTAYGEEYQRLLRLLPCALGFVP